MAGRPIGQVGAGGTPQEWFNSLPPITRAFLPTVVATTALCQFGVITPFQLALIWPRIISKFEIWRLIANLFFHGGFSFHFVINLYLIYQYSLRYELSPFDTGGGGTSADYAWMLAIGCAILSVFGYLMAIPFLGEAFMFMILYVWTRKNPTSMTSVFSFKMKAFYLPWALLAFNMLMGNSIMAPFLGVVAGHIYYFLHALAPQTYGVNIIRTPKFLCDFFGVIPPPPRDRGQHQQQQRQAAPAQPRGGHQWGSGQVLGGTSR